MIAAASGNVRRLLSRWSPGSIVLMYHRIDDPPLDPWGMCVSPTRFKEQMECLSRLKAACRLNDIQSRGGRVAVTFDDGYADNLHAAKPILERYDIPASVFVISGNSDQHSFWWDLLEQILLLTTTLPPNSLVLDVHGQNHLWSIDPQDLTLDANTGTRLRRWVAWRDDPPTSRHAVFLSAWNLLRELESEERTRCLTQICEWARAPIQWNGARPMTSEELRRISDDGLIEIGAHTVTHRRLSALSREEQFHEMAGSRDRIAEILGELPRSFSYPFGGSTDYTRETVTAVRDAGFDQACCTAGGAVRFATDPLQLPRVHAGDMDVDQFTRCLSQYLKVKP
jgi:peptidoglycan/xylan/chitin deacetylase (PgdA/CDA1 family)